MPNDHDQFMDNILELMKANGEEIHPALAETFERRRNMNEDEWITGIEQALVPASYLDMVIDELDPNYRELAESGMPRPLLRMLVQLELIIVLIDVFFNYHHDFVAAFLRIMAAKLEENGIGVDPEVLNRMADSLSADIEVPNDLSSLIEGDDNGSN